ncbi:MAG: M20/M25/M40 family metallo-hydrolase [Bacteroidales bacterium]|nr:M20/M25/M40 family metallo-hydrolase [Bacteroidales bacterium]
MKKIILLFSILIFTQFCRAQMPHIYDHTFPEITSQDEKVIEMLNQVSEAQIISDVTHLSSYLNRRADAIHIYNVKDWLASEYQKTDVDSVYFHDFQVIPFWDTVPKPFTTAPNILALKIGKKYPDEFVVCGAHYDSYVRAEGNYNPDTLVSPGADDNASGVAGILSAARILSNYEFERSIIFASWNAEEFGLCGSHAYAKDCRKDSVDIVAYFNLDMTGYLNPGDNIHIALIYTQCDSLLGEFYKQVGHVYTPNIPIYQDWLISGDTDFSSFNRNGYQAITPSEDVRHMSPYIHSIDDIIGLSVNNWEQTVIFTKLNLACVALAAGIIPESVNEIDFKDEEIESFEVYDIFGRLVYTEKSVWKNMEEIRVTNLASGVYIVRFFTVNGNDFTKKFFLKY